MQNQPRIIFYAPFAGWTVHNQFDAVIGRAVAERGGEVLVAVCDGIFTDCYVLAHSKNRSLECQTCRQKGQELFRNSFGLPTINLSELISPEDRQLASEWSASLLPEEFVDANYKGIEIGSWVYGTVCSYFRVTMCKLNSPEIIPLHRNYLRDSLIVYLALNKLASQYRPTHISVFQGTGAVLSPAHQVAKEYGAKLIAHEKGRIEGSFVVTENFSVSNPEVVQKIINDWIDYPITESQGQRCKEFFNNRETGGGAGSYIDEKTLRTGIRKTLGIPPDAKILSLFTSSEYETVYFDELSIVTKQLEMVQYFVDYYSGKDVYLVIRHHPQIGGASVGKPEFAVIDRILKQNRNFPKNVRVIMPHEDISSYSLLWNSCAAISTISTIGIEAIARGAPSMALSVSEYKLGLNIVIDNIDRESCYKGFSELDELINNFSAIHYKKVFRLTDAMFFKFYTNFKTFGVKNWNDADIRVQSSEDIQPGKDASLDKMCNYFFGLDSIYNLPDATTSKDLLQEDLFLNRYHQEVITAREVVAKNEKEHIENFNFQKTLILSSSEQDKKINIIRTPELAVATYQEKVEWRDNLGRLLEIISNSDAKYCLIINSKLRYDESVVIASQRILENNQAEALLWGAWLKDPHGTVVDILFHRGFTEQDLVKLNNYIAGHDILFTLICLGFYKRNYVVELINLLLRVGSHEDALKYLVEQICSIRYQVTGKAAAEML